MTLFCVPSDPPDCLIREWMGQGLTANFVTQFATGIDFCSYSISLITLGFYRDSELDE